jgi:glycogen debranching enzyme
MGHLLHSGMLTAAESRLVADRLVHPSMSSGFGLRTMSSNSGGYSPLSYHCGSVWPHDTAIAIHGLLRAGFPSHAVTLANGLLAASAAFDGRLPELFGGFAADEVPVPVPYPASCRPQAWSAASAIVLLQTHLGLTVDVPGGTAAISPPKGAGAMAVTGLRLAGVGLAISADASGAVTSVATDAQVAITTG